jgi:methionyl aminopeptidase
VQREVRRRGFHVIRELGGHGIGRTIHEPPSIPNFADPQNQARLTERLVLTIEPVIAAGTAGVVLGDDQWTFPPTALAVHYEHTLIIARGEPILLTAA